MRPSLISDRGFLVAAAALILIFSPCRAGEISPSLDSQNPGNLKSESESHKFDVRTSQSFFILSNKYPGLGYNDLLGIYHPRSLAPLPDYRSLDEKINDYLIPLLQYPGGALLCGAVQAGFEFLTYSKELTTYGYGNFYTGFDFNKSLLGGSYMRTGIFYSF